MLMNFQIMHLQKKLVFFAALAGVIAMFLPWVNISAFGMDVGQNSNGLKGSGILMFFLFIACGLLSFSGKPYLPFSISYWFIAQVLAAIIVLITVMGLLRSADGDIGGMGIVEAKPGVGFYLALVSGICINIFLWIYKGKDHTLKSGFESAKEQLGVRGNSHSEDRHTHRTSMVSELEKIIKMKNEGLINEEEYIQLKKRIGDL